MIRVEDYVAQAGNSPFARWFDSLDSQAAAKVTTALERMARGNFSNEKRLGGGVLEYRINFGPGYRIYYGWEGDSIVILLGGGTKQGQNSDIAVAQRLWTEYKRRKRQEG